MFDFLKPEISVERLAELLWQSTNSLAAKNKDMDTGAKDVLFEELVYFIAFSRDITIYNVLKKNTSKALILHDAFLTHVNAFASAQRSKLPPTVEWLDKDSSMCTAKESHKESGDAAFNVAERFKLYTEAMARPNKRLFAPAVLFAAWCNSSDISIIMGATILFSGSCESTQFLLKKVRIT